MINFVNNVYFFFNFMEFLRIIYETILHMACKSGNTQIVKCIISLNHIDINSQTILFVVS